jgi:ferredoxin
MPKIRVLVDEDLCIGAASCVTIAPETFQLNEENKAWVLDHGAEPEGPTYERWMEVSEDEMENILLAAQSCPTLAIFIYLEDGTQIFPDM